MPECDYVIRDLVIKQKASFNMIELYNTLKEWFRLKGYILYEKEYDDKIKNNKKDTKIKWEATKAIDDYTLFTIELSMKISDYKIISTKKEKLVDGSLKMEFKSYIETDFEEKWESNPLLKFIRGTYDKVMNTEKRKKYEKTLNDNTHEAYNKTKFFLNMYKFK